MKKNIYIFTSKSPEFGGGVEKVSRELGYGFIKTGRYNVNFIFPGKESNTEEKEGIKFITIKNRLNIPFFGEVILNLKLIKIFKNLSKTDIVINNGFSPYFYMLFFKKQFKLVHICHGTLYGSSCSVKNRGFSFFKKWVNIIYARSLDILVNPILKKSDLVITLSKYLRDELIQHYKVDANKIAIIYNGCDINPKNLVPHQKNSPLKVVFTGSDYGRKGLNILEGVSKKMVNENIQFYIIGVDSYKTESNNIKSLGRLKREEVYKNMAESDVIFLPSHYEGQPLVLLEAMSFGCIPVYSNFCHMDMLEGTEFEKFCSNKNSIDNYVKMFSNILSDKERIGTLRNLSKDIVSKYVWDNQISQYIALIDKL